MIVYVFTLYVLEKLYYVNLKSFYYLSHNNCTSEFPSTVTNGCALYEANCLERLLKKKVAADLS